MADLALADDFGGYDGAPAYDDAQRHNFQNQLTGLVDRSSHMDAGAIMALGLGALLFVYVMDRSGFRAMVVVGR